MIVSGIHIQMGTGKVCSQWPGVKPFTEFTKRRWLGFLKPYSHGNDGLISLD